MEEENRCMLELAGSDLEASSFNRAFLVATTSRAFSLPPDKAVTPPMVPLETSGVLPLRCAPGQVVEDSLCWLCLALYIGEVRRAQTAVTFIDELEIRTACQKNSAPLEALASRMQVSCPHREIHIPKTIQQIKISTGIKPTPSQPTRVRDGKCLGIMTSSSQLQE